MSEYYIGLLSGTSMDAVDSALVDFSDETPKLISTHNEIFPINLKKECESHITKKNTSTDSLEKLNIELGHLFATAANNLISQSKIEKNKIIAIGSHGQTIFHKPNDPKPFSLQIGDGNIIASSTNIKTIADFRSKDISLGGQGAPLTPAFHEVLFRNDNSNQAVINIGGITNITYLPKDFKKLIIGFDSGPGNTLLDLWAEKYLNKTYDENGNWGKSGKINLQLLESFLNDGYFKLPLPKSTGREHFNLAWLENYLTENLKPEDVQATLVELTAKSIANHIEKFAPETQEIILCGGGTHNDFLCLRIQENLKNIPVFTTEKYGFHPDWIEAMTFAWLAKQNLDQKPGNLPSVTGATKAAVLGSVYFA